MTRHEGDVVFTHSPPLRGRERELAALDDILGHAATGRGGARVIVGGQGLGKTALLDAAASSSRSADGFRVLRACGTPAESALPYAGLHQLLLPLGDLAAQVPQRHRTALLPLLNPTADVDPPGTLALYAALHALLVTAARAQPTLCCVDAAHDLDKASLDALGFVARRSDVAPLVVLFAADLDGTDAAETLAALPWLHLDPVADDAAHRILTDRIGPIPHDLSSGILDIADGNPLRAGRTRRARHPGAAQRYRPAAVRVPRRRPALPRHPPHARDVASSDSAVGVPRRAGRAARRTDSGRRGHP